MKKEKCSKPLVSIIIPVYNGENYVRDAIDSALNQTYKNIEIIVVNDGSTDNTEKICLSYGDQIRYFSKENGGVSTALNLGIEKMKGEYFSWLSHDDVYLPNKLEKQINYLMDNNMENNCIFYSDYLLIDEQKNIIGLGKKNHSLLQNKIEYSLLRGSFNGITCLIPKTAFDEFGLFDTDLKCTQDYDMWFKMQKKYKFIHIPFYLACTRIHDKQDTKVKSEVITEGNVLWIKMIESISDSRKKELENSIYNYYNEMRKFLLDTPYQGAIEHVEKKLRIIENKVKKTIFNEELKVSVIIPFFNREKLTVRAIKSVLNQTYKNIEIILIDDCSTNKITGVQKLINKNKNIKYYRNSINKGPSASRNVGIMKCTGDFIAFLDSDDEFLENKIELQLTEMLKNNSMASYTNYYTIEDDVKSKVIAYTEKKEDKNEFIYNCKLATPTVMVNKNFLFENKIKYDSNINVCEDMCFYLDIMKNTDFLYINDFLTNVYVNKNSCINDFSKRKQGLKNLIMYVYKNKNYLGECDKDLELLFEGYIEFNYLEQQQNNVSDEITEPLPECIEEDVSIFRKLFRKIVPFEIRKRMKKIIYKE